MAHYAIGDIHGCFEPFQSLLATIGFNPGSDTLWLTGDLINRGPQSLEVLEWVIKHDHCVQTVLGNHEFHLLVTNAGHVKISPTNSMWAIINAPHSKQLLEWVRQQPLMYTDGTYHLVHAGLLPAWTIKQALTLADEIHQQLIGTNYLQFLARLYGDHPSAWDPALKGMDRWRLTVNAMTRMRLIHKDGSIDFNYKGELRKAPDTLIPWFEATNRQSANHIIVCGHWAALGLRISNDVLSIDSGCLWGGGLTAISLPNKKVWNQPCKATRKPG